MEPFTFEYKGETIKSMAALSFESGKLHYKVKIAPDIWITIAPSGLSGAGGKIIWLQLHGELATAQPNELVPAMGEGIGALG